MRKKVSCATRNTFSLCVSIANAWCIQGRGAKKENLNEILRVMCARYGFLMDVL